MSLDTSFSNSDEAQKGRSTTVGGIVVSVAIVPSAVNRSNACFIRATTMTIRKATKVRKYKPEEITPEFHARLDACAREIGKPKLFTWQHDFAGEVFQGKDIIVDAGTGWDRLGGWDGV